MQLFTNVATYFLQIRKKVYFKNKKYNKKNNKNNNYNLNKYKINIMNNKSNKKLIKINLHKKHTNKEKQKKKKIINTRFHKFHAYCPVIFIKNIRYIKK